jgi:hypothetical protein
MRTAAIRLALLAATGALALPATALAATQLSITPKLSGTLGGNGAIAFNLTNTNTLGGVPEPLSAPFVAQLPAGITYNVGSFATCPMATILAANGSVPPACPAGSQVGSGTAALTAQLGATTLNETAAVRVYLTRKSPVTVQFWGNGTTPIAETLTFAGTLTKAAAPYGEKLSVQVPAIPTVSGGPDASVVSFDTTFNATRRVTRTVTVKKGRKTTRRKVTTAVSEFTLPKKCTGSLHWAGAATYADGTSSSTTAATACPKK